MADTPIDRRSAIKAAAARGAALAAGTIAVSVPVSFATATAAADDAALAAAVESAQSRTRGALNRLFPVFRVWDDVADAYPPRIPGAVNIFFGPVPPGPLMDAAMDYWATPDSTTLDEVISEIQNASSRLNAAVRTATTAEVVEFKATDLAPVDNRAPKMGTLSGAADLSMGVPVLAFGDDRVEVAGATWRTPVGWSACRVYIDWGHNVASIGTPQVSWQARLVGYGDGADLTATPGLQTLAQIDSGPPAAKTVKRFLIAGSFTLDPAGAEVRIAIARLATTFGGDVGLIKVVLERTA